MGLSLIVAFQDLGIWLRPMMSSFSFLGVEVFYFLVMPAVLWCWDVGVGFRVGLILLTSATINVSLKLLFGLPRPYWVTQRVHPHALEASFGLPSGHAQNSVAVWGRLALAQGETWAAIAAAGLTLMISLSRLYLGVHFPLDLFAGWLIGGLVLTAFLSLEQPVWRAFSTLSRSAQLGAILLLSLAVLWLGLAIWSLAAGRSLPVEWVRNIAAAHPGGQFVDPRSPEDLFVTTGTLLGLGMGGVLLQGWDRFSAAGSWELRTARYIVGAVGVSTLFFGLDLMGPAEGQVVAFWWTYGRFAVIGFWIAYLAPRSFVWLNLAPGEGRNP